VAAYGREAESRLNHLRGAGTVDDGIDLALAGGRRQLLADIGDRLVLGADDVIGAELLGGGR
jgi:hypothetical protein